MANGLTTVTGRSIQEGLYPHPTEISAEPLFYREQYLRKFSASIREEIDWTEKIGDRRFIAAKLREAASADSLVSGKRIYVWDKEDVDFVYQELVTKYKPYVEECKESRVQPSIDGVWRIDGFANENLRRDLIKAAVTLEDDPQKKWHPESNQQLLDLIHPSWWPIIYNRSKNINGEIIKPPIVVNHDSSWDDKYTYSEKFCWLPSEFEISSDGKTRIMSYINNLALLEQTKTFYPILEDIFSKFVPLFNHVLADLRREIYDLARVQGLRRREQNKHTETVLEDAYTNTLEKLFTQFERGEKLTADLTDEVREPRSILKPVVTSNPFGKQVRISNRAKLTGSTWEPPTQSLLQYVKLQGTTVNVIVKMATIVLTPEKPQWGGGPWHIEALRNERIIATGIYYYDQENITASSLGFRRAHDRIRLRRDEEAEISRMHNTNIKEGGPIAQEIGSIATKCNRAVVFPNIFQHRIEPFELIDNTKKGYRRILAFFLCDPSGKHEIPTTKTVPAQQPDVQEAIVKMLYKTGAGNLPVELFQMVTKNMPPAISREEAERYKTELMEERTKFRKNSGVATRMPARLLQSSD
ncbi:hypothetical protein TWF225_001154 [Orbilia oligospora]|nr:hypothetical protein TWF225_001154 [Orbilia oligospora]KAF3234937.1 hypothetical protein TWF128_002184 [Orbilia oligospora]KAF3238130.1 hypothetical protein TWF217_001772 [Orbilia oligospora]KAF3276492.1 hypothetical protein TWF132_002148 [Orbilia oligospora]